MTKDERADIEDAISELLAWGHDDRYRRKSCDIAVAAMRAALSSAPPDLVPVCSKCGQKMVELAERERC